MKYLTIISILLLSACQQQASWPDTSYEETKWCIEEDGVWYCEEDDEDPWDVSTDFETSEYTPSWFIAPNTTNGCSNLRKRKNLC